MYCVYIEEKMRGSQDSRKEIQSASTVSRLGQGRLAQHHPWTKRDLWVSIGRVGDIDKAVQHAQATLAPLRGMLSHRSRAYDVMLKDVVALLAYQSPEVFHSTDLGSSSEIYLAQ